MRVVFDSNILISALVFPGQSAERAMFRVLEGVDQLLISKPVLDEVLWVLARKFARESEELARVAVLLTEIADLVTPAEAIQVLKDDPDNRVLECAVDGGAEVIVTGDRAMLDLRSCGKTRIVSLRPYLEMKQALRCRLH